MSPLSADLETLLVRFGAGPRPLWVAAVAGAIVLVLGVLVHRLVFAALRRFAEKTVTEVDDRLVERMRPASRILVVLFAIHAALLVRSALPRALLTAVLVVESFVGVDLVVELAQTLVVHYWLSERRGVRIPAVVRHVILIVLYALVGLTLIGSLTGIDLVPFLATSTVLTVVLGFALQDTLGNLVSGLALHFEQPFSLGDWILVDGVEGEVISLGWRSTHLRTLSDDVVAMPNSAIARGKLQNFYAPTRRHARRIDFFVPLDAKPATVDGAVLRAASRTPRVLAEPKVASWLVAVTPLAQRYSVRFFLDDFRVHDDVESELLKAIVEELSASGLVLRPALNAAHVDVPS